MAFKPGKGAFLALDSVAGSPVDVSAYADSFSFPQPVDQLNVTTFGATAQAMIPGLTDGGQFSVSGPLDVAMGTFVAALKAAQAAGSTTSTIQYGPGGSVSGQIKVSAECYVAAYNITTPVAGRVDFDASLQITGVVTNGTW